MANDCLYEMRIRGTKKEVDRFVECLKADYDYTDGKKPTHKHFFRVFDCYDEDDYNDVGNGLVEKYVWGYCAWSVHSCMYEGESTYYEMLKENHPDTFMGTCLREASKNLQVEIFSEEIGMCFAEHYYYKNGQCLCDESEELKCKEKGDDYIIYNPYRRDRTEEFEFEYL